jgi:hypothetical protein
VPASKTPSPLTFDQYSTLTKGQRIARRSAHASRPSGLDWANEQKADIVEYAARNPWLSEALGPGPRATVIEGSEGAIAFVFQRSSA